ncbi:MAG: CPBP family intramembrane glutamic endopeptidase [Myxococcales bacterium]
MGLGDDTPAAGPEPASAHRRGRLLELLVFLFLIVPSMVFSFFDATGTGVGFVLTAMATILRDLSLVSLIAFVLWRNGEPVRRIGWTRGNGVREVIVGLLAFVVVLYGAALLQMLLRRVGLESPEELPGGLIASGAGQLALASILVIVVAFAEETIFRGYLILRLFEVTHSRLAALSLSAAIFAVGHGYEGTAGVATVGAMGFAFGLVYLWRGSLIAPIVMHFLQNFTVLVLLPVLGLGP